MTNKSTAKLTPPTSKQKLNRDKFITSLWNEGKRKAEIIELLTKGKRKTNGGSYDWQHSQLNSILGKLNLLDKIPTKQPVDGGVNEIESDCIADVIEPVTVDTIEPEAVVSVAEVVVNDETNISSTDDNKPLFVVGKDGAGGSDPVIKFSSDLMSWNQLVCSIQEPITGTAKLDAPYFLCSQTKSRNKKEQLAKGQYNIIKADLDGGVPAEKLYPILKSFNCKVVAYSTYSASNDCQKWRVVKMLNKPANAEEFVMLSAIFNDKLETAGIAPDRSSERVAQISFMPNDNGVCYISALAFKDEPPLDWSTVWANELADKKAEKIKLDADKAQRFEQSRIKAATAIANGAISVVDAWNDAVPIELALEMYGYEKISDNLWLSPYSTSGVAGVSIKFDDYRGVFKWFSHHESDDLKGVGKWGDSFDLYAHFEQGVMRNADDYKTQYDEAIKAAGAMLILDDGKTITKTNQDRYTEALKANTDNSEIDGFLANAVSTAATSKRTTLPLDFKLHGQRNGEVTVAEIQDKASISHYKKDLFLHPYAPIGDTNYYFTLEQCTVGTNQWERLWSIGDPNDNSNHYPFEPLPVEADETPVDETPKPKFSLNQFALNGSSDAMRSKMLRDVFVLLGVALLGQSTVIYAKPNSGKTLLVLWLLVESIKADRIKGENVYYINADDTYKGLVTKLELAEKYGFNMLAPNENGFKSEHLSDYIKSMIDDGTAHGAVIVLDTLKKFTDLMDKKQGTKFGKMGREFVSAGGTLITLAHTNKNRNSDGKVVFGGTSDIVDDCDCAFTLDEVSNDELTKQVLFENFKSRGNVEQKLAFSYAAKSSSYEQLFDSIQQGDENTIDDFFNNLTANYQLERDKPAIDAIIDAISQGNHSRTELITYAAKTNSIPKPKLTAVLDNYAGDSVSLAGIKWRVTTGNKNSKLYFLDDAVTGQIELEG